LLSELQHKHGVNKDLLKKFVEMDVDTLFMKLDKEGTGKLTPEAVEKGLEALVGKM